MTVSHAPDIETVVIGGGVVGLAIAAECARQGQDVYLLERNIALGQEVSSRSSEVIHAGIYYPDGSMRARLCVEGKHLLYDYAKRNGVAAKRLGKLVVATAPEEIPALDAIAARATANGVNDLTLCNVDDIHALEPDIAGIKGVLSPSTGIIDSHGLIQALERDTLDHGGTIVLATSVNAVEYKKSVFAIGMAGGGTENTITARNVYVAAGLGMAALGNRLPRAGSYAPPHLSLAKGHYFATRTKTPFQHLVYPVPVEGGLGTHLTLDMDGRARFGPDVLWLDEIDYTFEDCDGNRRAEFERSIRRYWPGLPDNALTADYTGIRPKISRQGEPPRDFEIHGPDQHGIPRLIALYGIESPGLTSSLAIARYCAAQMKMRT